MKRATAVENRQSEASTRYQNIPSRYQIRASVRREMMPIEPHGTFI